MAYKSICHIVPNGNYYWLLEGTSLLHRADGPAYESTNGYAAWYWLGRYHREDGPAILWDYQHLNLPPFEEWYIQGKRLTGQVLQDYKRALSEKDEDTRLAILGILELQGDNNV